MSVPVTIHFIRSAVCLTTGSQPLHCEFSTECDLMLLLSIYITLSFPYGHPIAAYVFFLVFPFIYCRMFCMSVRNNEVESQHVSRLEYAARHRASAWLSASQLACRLVQLCYDNLRIALLPPPKIRIVLTSVGHWKRGEA
jgi:hypothetical protein